MIVVTGAAGFIGGNLVRALNASAVTGLLVVDDLTRPEKAANLAGCQFAERLGRDEFRRRVAAARLPAIAAIVHLGACTDTAESRAGYLQDVNVAYSAELLAFAQARQIPFVYASSCSVYGRGLPGRPAREASAGPGSAGLSPYAQSKLAFDRQVREVLPDARGTVLGLRLFNTYGPGERHKGRMASMIYQMYRQLAHDGVIRLFEGSAGVAAGEHRRDFVFAGDVAAVCMAAVDGPARRGIVDVGTGRSRSFNEAAAVVARTLGDGRIEYIPMPDGLRATYQAYAQADVAGLRQLGLPVPATQLDQGVAGAVQAWRAEDDAGSAPGDCGLSR